MIKFEDMNRENPLENIDIVYTWVDGSNEEWNKLKLETQKALNIYDESTYDCRFINVDELKYSLRSVEKYANWVKNVYIVVDGMCPSWLNTDNPRVHMVELKSIMPKDALPCFNSNAIEHCLINIPNLSEYFLYSNDDSFINDYVTPEFFFKKSKPIYRYNRRYKKGESFYSTFLINSEELIFKKYGKLYDRHPHHCIDPYVKSDMEKCYKLFKEEIDKTIHSPFRRNTDIQRSIYAGYALATGKGCYKKVSRVDKYLALPVRIYNSIRKIYKKDSQYMAISSIENVEYLLNKFHPALFCINDDEKAIDEQRLEMKTLLENMYPQKSQFEK